MPIETPPTLPTIPAFPSLSERALGTYNSSAYEWASGWKDDVAPAVAALAGNTHNNATEAQASAATASSAAATATAQATTASTAAATATAQATNATNAANVQGTSTSSVTVPTAEGQSRTWRYVESNRAIAVGMHILVAVTASPTVNWALVQVSAWDSVNKDLTGTVVKANGTGTYSAWTLSLSGPRGAAGSDAIVTTPTLALSGTPTLVVGNNGYACDLAAGTAVVLDTLSVLGDGWGVTLIPANTSNPATVTADFGSGTQTLPVVAPTMLVIKRVATTYTVRWIPLGEIVPAFGSVGTPSVVASSATAGIAIANAAVDTALVFYTGSSGNPRVALVNGSGVLLSTTGDLEAVALSGATPQAVRLTDTTALAIWSTASAVKAVVMQHNSGAAAVGTIVTLEGVASTCQALAGQTSTAALACYSDTSNSRTRAMVLSISGTAITTNTAYTINAANCTNIHTAAISSTQAVSILTPTSNQTLTQAIVITAAGTVLTYPASLETIARNGASGALGNADVVWLSGSQVLVTAGCNPEAGGRAVAFVLDVAGTGTAATLTPGAQTPIGTPGTITSAHRLWRLSNNTALWLGAIRTSGHAAVLQQLIIESGTVRPGPCKPAARSVAHQDLCVVGSNILVAYADAANSSASTVVPVAQGSVR